MIEGNIEVNARIGTHRWNIKRPRENMKRVMEGM
jgi:hypothetical protein